MSIRLKCASKEALQKLLAGRAEQFRCDGVASSRVRTHRTHSQPAVSVPSSPRNTLSHNTHDGIIDKYGESFDCPVDHPGLQIMMIMRRRRKRRLPYVLFGGVIFLYNILRSPRASSQCFQAQVRLNNSLFTFSLVSKAPSSISSEKELNELEET